MVKNGHNKDTNLFSRRQLLYTSHASACHQYQQGVPLPFPSLYSGFFCYAQDHSTLRVQSTSCVLSQHVSYIPPTHFPIRALSDVKCYFRLPSLSVGIVQ